MRESLWKIDQRKNLLMKKSRVSWITAELSDALTRLMHQTNNTTEPVLALHTCVTRTHIHRQYYPRRKTKTLKPQSWALNSRDGASPSTHHGSRPGLCLFHLVSWRRYGRWSWPGGPGGLARDGVALSHLSYRDQPISQSWSAVVLPSSLLAMAPSHLSCSGQPSGQPWPRVMGPMASVTSIIIKKQLYSTLKAKDTEQWKSSDIREANTNIICSNYCMLFLNSSEYAVINSSQCDVTSGSEYDIINKKEYDVINISEYDFFTFLAQSPFIWDFRSA